MNYLVPAFTLASAILAGCSAFEQRAPEPARAVIPATPTSAFNEPLFAPGQRPAIIPYQPSGAASEPVRTAPANPAAAKRTRPARTTPMICENRNGDQVPCPAAPAQR